MSLLGENCFPTYPDITNKTNTSDDDLRIVVSSVAQMKDKEIDVRSLFIIEHYNEEKTDNKNEQQTDWFKGSSLN
jgi:hypothetical protein